MARFAALSARFRRSVGGVFGSLIKLARAVLVPFLREVMLAERGSKTYLDLRMV